MSSTFFLPLPFTFVSAAVSFFASSTATLLLTIHFFSSFFFSFFSSFFSSFSSFFFFFSSSSSFSSSSFLAFCGSSMSIDPILFPLLGPRLRSAPLRWFLFDFLQTFFQYLCQCVCSSPRVAPFLLLPSAMSTVKPAAGGAAAAAAVPKKRTFRTFQYRGIELEKLLDLQATDLLPLFKARQRRKFGRGIKRKTTTLIKKLRKSKAETVIGEKPIAVNTHMRDTVIVPEMIGSVVGVYNGKTFINVEIKPEMVGYYVGEFSITYRPIRHGKPGIGATNSSRFIPLK
eukprot:GHVT01009286.1.p1 GENE.GHVT01009286.1~~GHVT01009286.1.p1  ORF type:complete len:286 (+),score=71.43 GHVT01009286.1:681-1538(+)